ncbi:MAG TPA: hypothetical protein VM686_39665 [Polyangiaceae bacterium]|jgi:hypothetical protein|nr:hypothetical protein [Polyangiaceae bacterium]
MKASSILVAAGLIVLSLTACGGDDDDDDDGNGGGACAKGCSAASSLNCPNQDTCVSDCESELAGLKQLLPNCGAQIDAVGACFANLPVSNYSCNADGDVEPDMDQCQAEQDAVSTCANG